MRRHTRLNVPVSARRIWDCVSIPLDRVKAVKDLCPGITVNDVLLTISAGALRRYLIEKRDLPDKPLIAMAPISTCQEGAATTMGNQVSAILVDLATDEADPVRRLQRIHAGVSQQGLSQRDQRAGADRRLSAHSLLAGEPGRTSVHQFAA